MVYYILNDKNYHRKGDIIMNNNLSTEVRTNSTSFTEKLKRFFKIICSNNAVISGKREYFRMPIIVFLLIMLFTAELSVPLFIITLFCGMEYTFTGEDFSTPKKISFKG